MIVTVAAQKGGVGKTLIAYELAAGLEGVLVDADWDWGGATRMWGWRPERHTRAPLLDALDGHGDRPPTPRRHHGRPALVPSDDRLAELQARLDPTVWADRLAAWDVAWGGTVVVDTHPGQNPLTDGALAAAHLIVVPIVLGERELEALEGMLRERGDFPILIAPNRFRARSADLRLLEKLQALATRHKVPVAAPISDHPWLPRRRLRQALCLLEQPGKQAAKAAHQLGVLTRTVQEALRG